MNWRGLKIKKITKELCIQRCLNSLVEIQLGIEDYRDNLPFNHHELERVAS